MTKQAFDFNHFRAQVAEQDRAIALLRLRDLRKRLHKSEYQTGWYEQAPFSWFLKRGLRAFDVAVTNRMARQPRKSPEFDTGMHVNSDADPDELAHSYQRSVGLRSASAARLIRAILLPFWWAYRVLRKVARLFLGRVLRGDA